MRKNDFIKVVLWLFCLVFYIYQYAVRSAIPSVLNGELIRHFSTDATGLGTLVSVFYIPYTLMQLPVGLIADRFHPKKICEFALMCVSIGIILFISTTSLIVASCAQIIIGTGCSFAFVLVLKVTNETFSQKKVAFVTSITTSLGCLGPVVLGVIILHATQFCAWEKIVICVGIFGAILSLLCFLFASGEKKDETFLHVNNTDSIMKSLSMVLKNPQVWIIGIFTAVARSPIMVFADTWGISFLKNVYTLDINHASSYNYLVHIGIICGAPIFGWISNVISCYKRPIIFGTAVMLISFASIITLDLSYRQLYCALFAMGFSSGCLTLAFPAALCLVEKKLSATVSGVVNMIMMISVSILTPFVGFIMDCSSGGVCKLCYNAHDYTIAMYALLLCMVVAVFLSFFIKEGICKR